jgi:hypothetical protein
MQVQCQGDRKYYEQDHLEAMTLSIWLIWPLTVRLIPETDITPPLKQNLSPPLAKASAEFFLTALNGGLRFNPRFLRISPAPRLGRAGVGLIS